MSPLIGSPMGEAAHLEEEAASEALLEDEDEAESESSEALLEDVAASEALEDSVRATRHRG